MRKFRMKVNGKIYEVEVEEIGGTPVSQTAPLTQTVVEPEVEKPSNNEILPEGAEVVRAPLPGKIISLHVKVGQQVNEGDLLVVLEAMKMENEIFAGQSGVVREIMVGEGAAVDAEDILVVIVA
ncbi:MAG TPA: DUF2118 domain-containing protein [Clostridia bacterium]|jgi:biotin carboxyl carrier protein|nr:DUF2118 domain-containing protein [Clostridia bacterium]